MWTHARVAVGQSKSTRLPVGLLPSSLSPPSLPPSLPSLCSARERERERERSTSAAAASGVLCRDLIHDICTAQMPALKVKNKSNSDCVKDHHVHVNHKSAKSFKGYHVQQIGGRHITLQNYRHDVLFTSENGACRQKVDSILSSKVEKDNSDCSQLLNLTLASPDPTIEKMIAESSPCTSIMETIFSPSTELIDDINVHFEDDGNSSDFETSCLSNFFASDNVNHFAINEELSFVDVLVNSGSDYEYIVPELMLDMRESCMVLPLLEEAVETRTKMDCFSTEEAAVTSDESCLFVAIHQIKQSDEEAGLSFQPDDTEAGFFDPQMFLKATDLTETYSLLLPALLPKETRKRKPITLVLDLDETLVHSTLAYSEDVDFSFTVFLNSREHLVYVKRRPYLELFLERVAQMFEVVIFTASQSIYAEKLLDILDPEGRLISQRVYRESCIFSEGTYTKDLTVLGVDLAKVAIIDNSPQVFRLQVDNGIPIKSWFDDPSDHALISLLPFLETLVDAVDVRPIIAQRFGNKGLQV